MINHLSIGVRDVARSGKFYDAVLKPLGYARLSDGETSLGYGDKQVVLYVQKAERPVPPDMASGLHFCFDAPTRKSVDAFYKAALAAGGKDNGPAGLRADYGDNYYAGFVIDPDGYRLEAYCAKAE
jgi:catechol 2,3-dioxygenase-like lactoylglutathione lyase family enzyme